MTPTPRSRPQPLQRVKRRPSIALLRNAKPRPHGLPCRPQAMICRRGARRPRPSTPSPSCSLNHFETSGSAAAAWSALTKMVKSSRPTRQSRKICCARAAGPAAMAEMKHGGEVGRGHANRLRGVRIGKKAQAANPPLSRLIIRTQEPRPVMAVEHSQQDGEQAQCCDDQGTIVGFAHDVGSLVCGRSPFVRP